MAEINFISKDKEYTMLVDEEDLPLIKACGSISLHSKRYAFTSLGIEQIKKINKITDLNLQPKKSPSIKYGKGARCILIHRLIMKITDPKVQIDHINGNQLDNRKQNLRKATSSQNKMNRPKIGKLNPFKGVSKYKKTNKWRARIFFEKKEYSLGIYDNTEEAARAYDKAAVEFFGDFAYLNFPEEHYND